MQRVLVRVQQGGDCAGPRRAARHGQTRSSRGGSVSGPASDARCTANGKNTVRGHRSKAMAGGMRDDTNLTLFQMHAAPHLRKDAVAVNLRRRGVLGSHVLALGCTEKHVRHARSHRWAWPQLLFLLLLLFLCRLLSVLPSPLACLRFSFFLFLWLFLFCCDRRRWFLSLGTLALEWRTRGDGH